MSLFKSKKANDALGRSTTETMAYLTERNRQFQQYLEDKLAELAKKTVPSQTEFMSNEPELVVSEPEVVSSQAEETAMPLQGKWLGTNASPSSIETNALTEETSEQESNTQEKEKIKAKSPPPNWQDLLGKSAPHVIPIQTNNNNDDDNDDYNVSEGQSGEVGEQPPKTEEHPLEEKPEEATDPSTWDTPLSVSGELQDWD